MTKKVKVRLSQYQFVKTAKKHRQTRENKKYQNAKSIDQIKKITYTTRQHAN